MCRNVAGAIGEPTRSHSARARSSAFAREVNVSWKLVQPIDITLKSTIRIMFLMEPWGLTKPSWDQLAKAADQQFVPNSGRRDHFNAGLTGIGAGVANMGLTSTTAKPSARRACANTLGGEGSHHGLPDLEVRRASNRASLRAAYSSVALHRDLAPISSEAIPECAAMTWLFRPSIMSSAFQRPYPEAKSRRMSGRRARPRAAG